MAILRVARLGHPILRQRASEVEPADIRSGRFANLVDDMMETMRAYQGVGLAGPQVHLSLRIFVFAVEEAVALRRNTDPLEPSVWFNGTLEPIGDESVTDWEGCLSLPFLGGPVPRHLRVRLRGLDASGEPAEAELHGYAARIVQHETDHTDGLVYIDRMPDLRTLGYTINF